MPTRRLVGALMGFVAISATLSSVPARAADVPSPTTGHYGRLAPPYKARANGPSPGGAVAAHPPHLHRSQAGYEAQRARVDQGLAGRTGGVITSAANSSPTAPRVAATTAAQQPLAGFAAMSLSQQEGLGSGQFLEPPDTQLAVGPGQVAEATNSLLAIWSRPNTFLKAYDLNSFFSQPPGQAFTDPRLMYDAESQRWILTGLTFNPTTADSTVFIAISATSDPSATTSTGQANWNVNKVATRVRELADQPETGVNSDKVVISWNDYNGTSQSAQFLGSETIVLDKGDLLAGAAPRTWTPPGQPDVNRYRLEPAQSLSPTSTAWLTYNNADCAASCNTPGPTIGVIAVNGTPSGGNVTWSESDPAIAATAPPPPPRQPSGQPVDQMIDDSFLSSVWQNGTLWVSGNDACTPPGDSTVRSCMRLISLSTTGAPAVTFDNKDADPGLDDFYPAITMNDLGDLFIAYSQSSPTMFPSAEAIYLYAHSETLSSQITLAAGHLSYSFGSENRWGDYSAAARDPGNPAQAWLTAEYQDGQNPSDNNNWGTFVGVIEALPNVAGVSPSLGLIAGGQAVTLAGDDFRPNASVRFGSNTATNVHVVSADQITASTPPAAAAGTVDVTVTNPDNSSGTASSAYTYSTALGTEYTAVAPTRLLDTRQINGALGPGMTRSLLVAGTKYVPATAQTVVLNVTVTNTTAPSFLTVFPAGEQRPLASNLNWVAGKTVPNLVAVPVGEAGGVSFFNSAGNADVVVDLEGYFAPVNGTAGEFQPLPPSRILDTRTGIGAPPARLGAGTTLQLQVTGQGGLPQAGVSAVVMNMTVTNPSAAGYLTAWPAGGSQPNASNLNFTAGETIPNRVIVPVGANGQVSIFNAFGSTDVIADVNGYFTDAGAGGGQLLQPIPPVRVIDTRTSLQTLGPGATLPVSVAGTHGIPTNATAAILNVTTTNTTAPSFYTVFPGGASSRPTASDLNWLAGWTVPNLVVVKLAGGGVNVYNSAGSADAVVDAFGYFTPYPGIVETAQPSSLKAGSSSTSTLTAVVTAPDGSAGAGDTVAFTTSGASCGTITGSPATADPNGVATATYTAAPTPGTCTITASDPTRGFTATVTVTQT